MRLSWQPLVHSPSGTTPAPPNMHWSCYSISGSALLDCHCAAALFLPPPMPSAAGTAHVTSLALVYKTCVPLLQVSGRVAALAMSHTASRIIQACAKHGSPTHRQALMKEVAEKPIDVAKSSYGHFLVCRLIALAGKEELAGQRPAWPHGTALLTVGHIQVCSRIAGVSKEMLARARPARGCTLPP